jgi:hypothetical protein
VAPEEERRLQALLRQPRPADQNRSTGRRSPGRGGRAGGGKSGRGGGGRIRRLGLRPGRP